MSGDEPLRTIGEVERETGIARETLRVWERRYGFPQPQRNARGERLYPIRQVERLRLISRLIDHGFRPGKVAAMPGEELAQLAALHLKVAGRMGGAAVDLVDALVDGRIERFERGLEPADGLTIDRWLNELMVPLIRQLGERWAAGTLEIHHEHLATRLMSRRFATELARMPSPPASQRPLLMLTTISGEEHSLGLQMVELLLTSRGVNSRNIGCSLPLSQIVRASEAIDPDVVALSYSSAFPHRHLAADLLTLRSQLPATRELWAGGEGVARMRAPDGVVIPKGVDGLFRELERLQARVESAHRATKK